MLLCYLVNVLRFLYIVILLKLVGGLKFIKVEDVHFSKPVMLMYSYYSKDMNMT